MNLPNKLTMLRIIAIPVFIVVLMLEFRYAATIIFILAAATDALDGHIARKHNLVSNFGKLMDPLADNLILAREFAVTGLRQVAVEQGIVIAAAPTGKIKTITQMIAIPLLLLDNWPFAYIGIPMDTIFLWIAVIMTVVSGTEYFWKNRQLLSME